MSFVEIVVVIAVIMMLTAAVAPGLIGVLDRKRVEAAAETLDEITDAMSQMRFDDNDWPGRVSHLAWPIAIDDLNIRGANFSTGKVGQWQGPYIDRPIPSTGLPIGIGTVNDLLVREMVSGNDGYLKLEITGVA